MRLRVIGPPFLSLVHGVLRRLSATYDIVRRGSHLVAPGRGVGSSASNANDEQYHRPCPIHPTPLPVVSNDR